MLRFVQPQTSLNTKKLMEEDPLFEMLKPPVFQPFVKPVGLQVMKDARKAAYKDMKKKKLLQKR